MAVTSDVERNKQVVCDQIAAMERLDAEAQRALMTDDVKRWVPQSAVDASGLARPLSGNKAVLELLRGADAFFSEMHWTIATTTSCIDSIAGASRRCGNTSTPRTLSPAWPEGPDDRKW